MVHGLKDSDPIVRARAAVDALGCNGGTLRESAGPAVPSLVDALPSDEPQIRWHVAEVLRRMGGQASDAVPALVGTLRDRDPDVRARACRCRAARDRPAAE
jgi:HEAT repeat protein